MNELLFTCGLLLLGGTICGTIARWLKLPTLTGYIAAGILLGSQGLDLLPHHHVKSISEPVNDIAMALVLFVLGGQFKFAALRGRARKLLSLSAVESSLTFLIVVGLSMPVLEGFAAPLLLGVMAVAIAPATTLLVLDEFDAHGNTTDTIKLLTAMSNVWAVLFFELVLLVLAFLSGSDEVGPSSVAWDIAGSLLFGLVAGHALIVMQDRTGHGNYTLPLIAVLALAIGGCKLTGVPHMLAFLVTGAVVANRSRYFEPITTSMQSLATPAYVAFFVLSGVHLNFGLLEHNWVAVGIYVLARTIGKIAGARLGIHLSGIDLLNVHDRSSPPLGLALLCQAGAAIALAHVASEFDPELGARLLNIVLGAVIVFELIGPLLVKHVVIAAGEVNIGHLLLRGSEEVGNPSMFTTLFRALRGKHNHRSDDIAQLDLGRVMRAGIVPLPEHANMDQILRYANHARFNQFPVVDDGGALVGLIRLRDLEDLAYDPHAASLVIAADLTSLTPEECALSADTGIEDAAAAFSDYLGNNFAVVKDKQSLLFMGMVERADLIRLIRQMKQTRARKNK